MLPFKPISAAIIILSSFTLIPNLDTPKQSETVIQHSPTEKKARPKIQVAVLLDVSNSMDGLINQAKAQLWNMVNVLGKAKCDEETPDIEIALYEYGRSNNNANQGYVKQINGFTNDLDEVSQNLFALTTNGGDEYCGHVIYNSLTEMTWDTTGSSYKVIFIAGNEDFLQGDINYNKACQEAKKKNVIVNTIYCGDKLSGMNEHWNLGAECGQGSYTNINSDAIQEEIPTPYDSTLLVLNSRLNQTYIAYGTDGSYGYSKQISADQMNSSFSTSANLKRVEVKSKKAYSNTNWDMVDAKKADSSFAFKVKSSDLPDSLKNKSKKELDDIITKKATERTAIQQEILTLSGKRDIYLVNERANRSNIKNQQTLESEIEKIIRQQALRYNMTIK